MISDGHSRHDKGSHCWPEVTSAGAIPTPYQIFSQKKGSKYSKLRFYELVKLYHPDRHDHVVDDGLSYSTKLERYRLVVAANDILSDPIKRSAYDRYGAGWNDFVGSDVSHGQAGTSTKYGTYTNRGWKAGPNSPMHNATWEDWERWYQRDAGGPQKETFSSNSVFVSLIMVFAAIGFVGQVRRVDSHTLTALEQSDALHITVSEDLRRRRQETNAANSNRDERIRSFLNQRGPKEHEWAGSKDQVPTRLLPPPNGSLSQNIGERHLVVYQGPKKGSGNG